MKFGFVSEKRKNPASLSDDLPFTEETSVVTFLSFAKLQRHLDFGHHHYEEKNAMQLARVSDRWVKRFKGTIEQRSSSCNNTANDEYSKSYLPTYLTTYLPTDLPTHLPTSLPTYLPTYLPFMMAERSLVLCLKRERILLHYQMISHLQKKHLLSRSYHLQNCSVILILDIIIMRKKMQCNLQGFLIGGLKDSKELLDKETPAAITQQMVNILN